MNITRWTLARAAVAALALGAAAPGPAMAQSNPFSPGWVLQPDASALRFTSVKNGSVVETSEFAVIGGSIEEDGDTEVLVQLDSVDTKIDLRNVRMRFLFFETFNFSTAEISLDLDPAEFSDLREVRRKTVTLPYTLELRGIERELIADVSVTLLSDDIVSITPAEPIVLSLEDFALLEGLAKLEEAAGVEIVPSATVTFDFLFERAAGEVELETLTTAATDGASFALETQGSFSQEECIGRFEILSRTGNIYFNSGSAFLRPESASILNSIADIVSRCPGMVIEVSGHTDSDGSPAANQRLSEARAASVVSYLVTGGVPSRSLVPVGFGEARPVVPNDTAQNKQRNRRIEFALAR